MSQEGIIPLSNRMEMARERLAKAREHMRALSSAGYDPRPELGLPPDATPEQMTVGIKEKYPDPHHPPHDSWAAYMWATAAAEKAYVEAVRDVYILVALQEMDARGVPEEETRRKLKAALEAAP